MMDNFGGTKHVVGGLKVIQREVEATGSEKARMVSIDGNVYYALLVKEDNIWFGSIHDLSKRVYALLGKYHTFRAARKAAILRLRDLP